MLKIPPYPPFSKGETPLSNGETPPFGKGRWGGIFIFMIVLLFSNTAQGGALYYQQQQVVQQQFQAIQQPVQQEPALQLQAPMQEPAQEPMQQDAEQPDDQEKNLIHGNKRGIHVVNGSRNRFGYNSVYENVSGMTEMASLRSERYSSPCQRRER